jgi:hypothetical protein
MQVLEDSEVLNYPFNSDSQSTRLSLGIQYSTFNIHWCSFNMIPAALSSGIFTSKIIFGNPNYLVQTAAQSENHWPRHSKLVWATAAIRKNYKQIHECHCEQLERTCTAPRLCTRRTAMQKGMIQGTPQGQRGIRTRILQGSRYWEYNSIQDPKCRCDLVINN